MISSTYRLVQQVLRFVGEAAWLLAWSAVLGHWLDPTAGPALPLWLLGCLLVAGAAVAGSVSRRSAPTWMPFAVSLLGVVAAVSAGLLASALAAGGLDIPTLGRSSVGSRVFVASCLALVAWWRGNRLGTNPPGLYEVEGQFRFGVLALAGLLALVAVLGAGAAPETITLVEPALVVVASGLLGVPLARIAETSGATRADSPQLAPSGPWIGTLLGVVGGLLLLTLLFAGVVTAERVGAILGAILGAVARVVGALILLVALPVSYVVEWLVNLLKSRAAGQPVEPSLTPLPPLDQLLSESQASGRMPPEFELLLQVILVAGTVGLIVILLARAFVRRNSWQREQDGVEELRESVFGWEAIRELLAWVMRRLRHPRAGAPALAAELDPAEPRSVREIYREFLRLTARLGFPRARVETPLEYARRIERDRLADRPGQEAPEGAEGRGDLDALTSSYVRARYGPPAAAPSDSGSAARALERLRALWTRRG